MRPAPQGPVGRADVCGDRDAVAADISRNRASRAAPVTTFQARRSSMRRLGS